MWHLLNVPVVSSGLVRTLMAMCSPNCCRRRFWLSCLMTSAVNCRPAWLKLFEAAKRARTVTRHYRLHQQGKGKTSPTSIRSILCMHAVWHIRANWMTFSRLLILPCWVQAIMTGSCGRARFCFNSFTSWRHPARSSIRPRASQSLRKQLDIRDCTSAIISSYKPRRNHRTI